MAHGVGNCLSGSRTTPGRWRYWGGRAATLVCRQVDFFLVVGKTPLL